MKLNEVTSELLKQAIDMYLAIAYPQGGWSESVAERARLPEGLRGAALLSDARFERVPAEAPVEAATRFNLRLGNAGYLHMKLGIDRVSDSDEYVLVVDTHDKHFSEMVQEKERQEYRDLLANNQRLHDEIQNAWSAAGLPTFERYLRSRLEGLRGRGGGKKA